MQSTAIRIRSRGKSIGLVPTMGALHKGHLSLIERARKENDVVVISIFVNPKQFGPNEDYLRYPRPLEADKRLCKKHGVDYIFAPEVEDMYPKGYLTYVNVKKMSERLCGIFRPDHFKGVATIVLKLFNITMPQKAYFGLKDYQQLKIIERMTTDLNLDVKIVPCPIIRENSGLALSSRNRYLSSAERNNSSEIFKSLLMAKDLIKFNNVIEPGEIRKKIAAQIKIIPGAKIDYIEVIGTETLQPVTKIDLPVVIALAVWVGGTRLIDNIIIERRI